MAPPYKPNGTKPASFTKPAPTAVKPTSIGGSILKGGNTNKGGGVGNPINRTFKPRKTPSS